MATSLSGRRGVMIMANWVITVDLSPGSNGIDGGPWRLVVTRTLDADHHWWWPLILDEEHSRGALVVHRDQDADLARVALADDRPFEEAATEFDLDSAVFGSMTIWPGGHHSGLGIQGGWVWTLQDRPADFPFLKF